MKKRKAELYEILSNNTINENHEYTPDESGLNNRQYKGFSRNRTGKEIVFSLDGAFVIFVIVLLLIGTAFYLGYQKGAAETKASFVRDVHPDDTLSAGKLKLVNEYNPPAGSIEVPKDKYSLKLISLKHSDENYRKLVDLKNRILGNALVASSKLHIFIFDRGTGGVYSLAIGLFDKTDDEMLVTMKEYFKTFSFDGKNPVFKNYSTERVEDLGEAKVDN